MVIKENIEDSFDVHNNLDYIIAKNVVVLGSGDDNDDDIYGCYFF